MHSGYGGKEFFRGETDQAEAGLVGCFGGIVETGLRRGWEGAERKLGGSWEDFCVVIEGSWGGAGRAFA